MGSKANKWTSDRSSFRSRGAGDAELKVRRMVHLSVRLARLGLFAVLATLCRHTPSITIISHN